MELTEKQNKLILGVLNPVKYDAYHDLWMDASTEEVLRLIVVFEKGLIKQF